MTTDLPDVSVVIPTRDRASRLAHSLDSVLASAAAADLDTEVLVVDNGSTDDTPGYLAERGAAEPRLRAVREDRPGAATARNTGVRVSRGRVILFTDDDIVVPREWLTAMARPLLGHDADAVAGFIRLAEHLNRPWLTPAVRIRLADTEYVWGDVPILVSANAGMRREVAEQIPFDEELGPGSTYGMGEDTLLDLQVREAGYTVAACREPAVVHHFDADRLEPMRLEQLARSQGRAEAYIHHHWLHGQERNLGARLVKHRVQLAGWSARQRLASEPLTNYLEALHEYSFFEQLRRERNRPPNYDVRGLRKHPMSESRSPLPAASP